MRPWRPCARCASRDGAARARRPSAARAGTRGAGRPPTSSASRSCLGSGEHDCRSCEADDVAAAFARRTRSSPFGAAVRTRSQSAVLVVDLHAVEVGVGNQCRDTWCASSSMRTRAMAAASASVARRIATVASSTAVRRRARTAGDDVVDGEAEVLEQYAARAPTRRSGRCRRPRRADRRPRRRTCASRP